MTNLEVILGLLLALSIVAQIIQSFMAHGTVPRDALYEVLNKFEAIAHNTKSTADDEAVILARRVIDALVRVEDTTEPEPPIEDAPVIEDKPDA